MTTWSHHTDGESPTHVWPDNDGVEHDIQGEECVCGPRTEAVFRDDGSTAWLVVHASLDGRELAEREP